MSCKTLAWILMGVYQIQLISGVFQGDAECGRTRGCYPETCPEEGCDFQLTWMDNVDSVSFIMTVEALMGDKWFAAGFSTDRAMPNTSVVMCKLEGGSPAVEMGHTIGRTYVRSATNYGLMDQAVSHTDNVTICSFKRIKVPTPQYADMVFALSDTPYLLHAYGNIDAGTPTFHGISQRRVSSSTVDFLSFGEPMQTTTESLAPAITASWLYLPVTLLLYILS